MGQLNVTYQYPYSEDYVYETVMKRINLDDRRKESLLNGKGFIINEPQSSIKKDLKNPNGIYSTRFGQTLQDVNPFEDRYKCECGFTKSRLYKGIECPVCKKRVKYLDDDFGYFGWITLEDPFFTIHPNLFKALGSFIGNDKFDNIIKPIDQKDENGFTVKDYDKPKDEPFFGIGILEFKLRFEEIMDYYLKKKSDKRDLYYDIMQNRDNIFTQSIPVFTTYLRPFKVDSQSFHFEGTNGPYNMMVKLASSINAKKYKFSRRKKTKKQLLYDLTIKFQDLYKELEQIVSGKKGTFRAVFGGRYDFTSRSVIVQDPSLRIDQVIMPYKAMVELLQQTIVNILQKSYNISYSQAYDIWSNAQLNKDQRVVDIIEGLIASSCNGKGIPILINRNPSIGYGSIIQMYIVGMCDSYTLKLPLQILPLLAADFDGDVLNILYLINRFFTEQAIRIFNPRNAMQISRNDGKMNNDINHIKDTIINANALINLARPNYTREQIEKIKRLKTIM